jgi:hypothetical protein
VLQDGNQQFAMKPPAPSQAWHGMTFFDNLPTRLSRTRRAALLESAFLALSRQSALGKP